MGAETVELRTYEIRWSDDAAALLAPAMKCDPGATVDSLRRAVNRRAAKLLGVYARHQLIAAVVLRVDKRDTGAEGVIVAAGGKLSGASLTRSLLPVIERCFFGVRRIRIHTARPGLVRLLARHGYTFREWVLNKEIAC